ncbi:putative DNA-binding protein escarola [Phtheirospermum japonicum]|uniref:AT-hook motif nuclear-localized protein n=1 Tax=Phtheirospermum japonicum TaxID=374723 RepID=A0A830CAX3_9LAMI|nr:putative DNA-binding protein escarola [Phtheirospermum japonicum]
MDSQESHHHHQQQQHPQIQPPPVLQHMANNNNSSYQPLPNTNNSIMHHQNPPFPFNSMAAPPLDHHLQSDGGGGGGSGGGAGGGFATEPARKKRGRPRKYSPDNSIGLGLSPAPVTQISSVMAHNDSAGSGGGTPSSENAAKRNRGRPPGSVKRQMNALGAPGVGFTPHVITVNAGEDIASKIMAFSQQGPRTVCILSANGAICNVTLRQPAMSGGTVTYEGRFEIISLSGSFLLSENNGNRSRTGGLSVSLAGSDGRSKSEGPSSTTHMLNFGGNTPSPGGGSSESGEENDDSPPVGGPYANAAAQPANMPMYSTMGWPNSVKMLPN